MGMNEEIAAIYDMLWETNFISISRGTVDIDPYISNPGSDQRRGLTLLFRPSPEITKNIVQFLDELGDLEPDQYFYSESNLHFTTLSLFTATPDHQREYDRLAQYQAAVEEAIRGRPPFSLHLKGLTVSSGAVMICGFPRSDTLNAIRQNLRQNLIQEGLSQGLDIRYTLKAAHTTVMRFANPLQNPERYCEFLLENKQREFGSLDVGELQLVKNDWYMSQQNTPIVARYTLGNHVPNRKA
jgi:2'-5' RNA ligase